MTTATCACTVEDGRIVQCSLHEAAPQMYKVIQLLIEKAKLFDTIYNSEFDEARAAIRAADGPPKCPHGAPSLDLGLYCSHPSCETCRARKGLGEVAW